jgi:MarR family transcriptional regulator, organic hydroperoxide resistance regulator
MNILNKDSLNSLLAQIMRYHHSRAFTVLAKKGLHRGQAPMLVLLWQKDGRTQIEIAEILHIKPATVSDCLQRLEKAGLVIRKPDPKDLRISRVFITENGKKIQEEVEKVLLNLEEDCFQNFTPEEKILLRRFLIQIRDNLSKVVRCTNEETV